MTDTPSETPLPSRGTPADFANSAMPDVKVIPSSEEARKTLDVWKEIDKELEEFVDGLSPEKILKILGSDLLGEMVPSHPAKVTPGISGTLHSDAQGGPRAAEFIRDRDSEISQKLESMEKDVRDLQAKMRIQAALMEDTRAALRRLLKK